MSDLTVYTFLEIPLPDAVIMLTIIITALSGIMFSFSNRYIAVIPAAGTAAALVLLVLELNGFNQSLYNNYLITPIDNLFKILIAFAAFISIVISQFDDYIVKKTKLADKYYLMKLIFVLGAFTAVTSGSLFIYFIASAMMLFAAASLKAFQKYNTKVSVLSIKFFFNGFIILGLYLTAASFIVNMEAYQGFDAVANFLNSPVSPIVFKYLITLLLLMLPVFYLFIFPVNYYQEESAEANRPSFSLMAYTLFPAVAIAFILRFILFSGSELNIDSMGGWELFSVIDWKTVLPVITFPVMLYFNIRAITARSLIKTTAYLVFIHIISALFVVTFLSNKGIVFAAEILIASALLSAALILIVLLIRRHFDISEVTALKGLYSKSPLYASLLTLVLLIAAGLPPAAFYSWKLEVLTALINTGMQAEAILLSLVYVLPFYYIGRILYYIFTPGDKYEERFSPAGVIIVSFLIIIMMLCGIYYNELTIELNKLVHDSVLFITGKS